MVKRQFGGAQGWRQAADMARSDANATPGRQALEMHRETFDETGRNRGGQDGVDNDKARFDHSIGIEDDQGQGIGTGFDPGPDHVFDCGPIPIFDIGDINRNAGGGKSLDESRHRSDGMG